MEEIDVLLAAHIEHEKRIEENHKKHDDLVNYHDYLNDELSSTVVDSIRYAVDVPTQNKVVFYGIYILGGTILDILDKNIIKYIITAVNREHNYELYLMDEHIKYKITEILQIDKEISNVRMMLLPPNIAHIINILDNDVISRWMYRNGLQDNWLSLCRLCMSRHCLAPISHYHYDKVVRTMIKFLRMSPTEKLLWKQENTQKITRYVYHASELEKLIIDF